MKEVKISAVSYLNSKPFIYGIQHSGLLNNYKLELDIPAVCADKLLNNKADIGLVPVAIIPFLKEYTILTDYCIGAKGAVGSVVLCSEVPLNEIKNIYLDYQSRTSAALLKIIASDYWKITPEWIKAEPGYENKIMNSTAGLIIGDRAFELKDTFKYSYDLAEGWYKHTGFPFVFACWIANKEIASTFTNSFNDAIKFGIEHKEEMISKWNLKNKFSTDVHHYLNNSISYEFDQPKKNALQLFLKSIKK